jgi:ribonuclease HI
MALLMPAVGHRRHHDRHPKKVRDWVRWVAPEPGWLKLNTDGASKGNPGKSGGGSILRDHQGNVIFTTYRSYGFQTALVAECLALIDGLESFSDLGLMGSGFRLFIESDSMILVNALSGISGVPEEIQFCWPLLHYWLHFVYGKFDVGHVYREGNTEADLLANKGVMAEEGVDGQTRGYRWTNKCWTCHFPYPSFSHMNESLSFSFR